MLNVAEIHSIQDGLFFFFPGGPAEAMDVEIPKDPKPTQNGCIPSPTAAGPDVKDLS